MIKNIVKILLFLFLFGNFSGTFAACPPACDGAAEGGNIPNNAQRTIEVTVTEDIPGLGCRAELHPSDETGEDTTGRYICDVPVGMEGALIVMGRLIRWLTGIALLGAVLFLVFNGIRLSAGGLDGNAKGEVKKNILMTLGGIVLLLLSGPILKLIAPWVYR